MNWFTVNVVVFLAGLNLMVGLPIHFLRKNARREARQQFQEYWQGLVNLDKQYAPHIEELNKHLNTINYWLKTTVDPTESEEDKERVEQEDRFFAGLMNPLEAKKWKEAVKNARAEAETDESLKAARVRDFYVDNMEPMEVEQTKMNFVYAPEYDDCIYYCVTPEALMKQEYRHVIFFTTSRPTGIPIAYPYKYEGAQMLSLYKHPAQTVWFLKNWKLIREGLEGGSEEDIVPLDESITDFDL